VKDAQDLARFAPHPVGNDVARLGHDQLAGAGRPAGLTETGLLCKHRNGIEYTLDDEKSGRCVVCRDVGGLIVEVAQRLAQPLTKTYFSKASQ
jgi:hypothetical protein